jgi:gliding motility-associated-like protein
LPRKRSILNPSSFNPQEVPNVFSPNNDGVNDAFCIPGTAGYQDCYKLEIFNRWGGVVYQSQNPQDCWQPQSNIASGVYFYVLTLGKQEYTGQVTVFTFIKGLSNDFNRVMIFGHNPTMTNFVNRCIDQRIDNVPTTGVACFNFEIESWKEATFNARLAMFDYPKKHRNKS